MIDNCKKYGVFDPKVIGSVSNIGLMTDTTEGYVSHDNNFQIPYKNCII